MERVTNRRRPDEGGAGETDSELETLKSTRKLKRQKKRVKTIGQWTLPRVGKREHEWKWRWIKREKHVMERRGNDLRRVERRRRDVVTTVGLQTRH